MARPAAAAAVLSTVALAAAVASGGTRILNATDPAAKPYKDAARALAKAIGANDAKAIDAAFAGTGDDRKLLDATVATVTALRDISDAMVDRFGDKAVPAIRRDPMAGEVRSINVQTVAVDPDHPDAASISPGHFPFVGYELARKGDRWVVTSITVFPEDVLAMRDAHAKLAPALDELAKRVKAGEFATADAAEKAMEDKLGPIVKAYEAATRKGSPPERVKRNPITGEPEPISPPPATTRPAAVR